MQPSQPYKVKLGELEFEFTDEDINNADLIERYPGVYHLISQNKSVEIKLLEYAGKQMKLEAGGENFYVQIKEGIDQMLDQLGFNNISSKYIKHIKAPMPGLVLNIAIEEGQEVNEGDKLLILEAMKMENSIQVNVPAKVKKILVKPGQAVEKGQLLIELE